MHEDLCNLRDHRVMRAAASRESNPKKSDTPKKKWSYDSGHESAFFLQCILPMEITIDAQEYVRPLYHERVLRCFPSLKDFCTQRSA
jgi:hypothetical protein